MFPMWSSNANINLDVVVNVFFMSVASREGMQPPWPSTSWHSCSELLCFSCPSFVFLWNECLLLHCFASRCAFMIRERALFSSDIDDALVEHVVNKKHALDAVGFGVCVRIFNALASLSTKARLSFPATHEHGPRHNGMHRAFSRSRSNIDANYSSFQQ